MKYADIFYNNLGYEPKEEEYKTTDKTFQYLIDNGFEQDFILQIMSYLPIKEEITPNDLPLELWENGLLEPNKFYYHNELHITSPAPYWDIESNKIVTSRFFLEMKIIYGIEDLINYYYSKFPENSEWKSENKDIGAINYLLNKYKRLKYISEVDFILFLIDYASYDEKRISNIIDLERYEYEVGKILKAKVNNATTEKSNVIVWR